MACQGERSRAFVAELLEMLKAKATEFELTEEALKRLAACGSYPEHPELAQQFYDLLFSAVEVDLTGTIAKREGLLRAGRSAKAKGRAPTATAPKAAGASP